MSMPYRSYWDTIADEFWERWQIPNCNKALDGKHKTIEASKSSGNVGGYGKNCDGGIFSNSNLGRALQNDKFNILNKRALPGTNTELPMIIVADEAFPLKTYMMRPYPGTDLRSTGAAFAMQKQLKHLLNSPTPDRYIDLGAETPWEEERSAMPCNDEIEDQLKCPDS
ncbi:hypothetical protein J437_LFUL008888 [Ladona fulva]|uniref:DDE Tnp4 domain-containing protein n=1 Tax=Ladona fulva TaxID=123851 RepID=A0A8K0P3Q2_LADFU|nr:hypothetical protein J437_LFUL008888 [Ladona fulva]